MKVKPVVFEVSANPIFLKRRLLPYGVRDPVEKVQNLVQQRILAPVESSKVSHTNRHTIKKQWYTENLR